MNRKSIVITAILAATVFSVIATPLAYADSSSTDTDQEIKQKNVGSGDSENNNCAQNLIKAGADRNCRNNN